jgi:hypothetical protein
MAPSGARSPRGLRLRRDGQGLRAVWSGSGCFRVEQQLRRRRLRRRRRIWDRWRREDGDRRWADRVVSVASDVPGLRTVVRVVLTPPPPSRCMCIPRWCYVGLVNERTLVRGLGGTSGACVRSTRVLDRQDELAAQCSLPTARSGWPRRPRVFRLSFMQRRPTAVMTKKGRIVVHFV